MRWRSGQSRDISVLAWNYHDDDVAGAAAKVRIAIAGVPNGRMLLRHYRIDETHSNAWTAWKKMGSPQQPSAAQYAELEAAGQLQELESPRWIVVEGRRGDHRNHAAAPGCLAAQSSFLRLSPSTRTVFIRKVAGRLIGDLRNARIGENSLVLHRVQTRVSFQGLEMEVDVSFSTSTQPRCRCSSFAPTSVKVSFPGETLWQLVQPNSSKRSALFALFGRALGFR